MASAELPPQKIFDAAVKALSDAPVGPLPSSYERRARAFATKSYTSHNCRSNGAFSATEQPFQPPEEAITQEESLALADTRALRPHKAETEGFEPGSPEVRAAAEWKKRYGGVWRAEEAWWDREEAEVNQMTSQYEQTIAREQEDRERRQLSDWQDAWESREEQWQDRQHQWRRAWLGHGQQRGRLSSALSERTAAFIAKCNNAGTRYNPGSGEHHSTQHPGPEP